MVIVVADAKRDGSFGTLSALPKDKHVFYHSQHVIIIMNVCGVHKRPLQHLNDVRDATTTEKIPLVIETVEPGQLAVIVGGVVE